MQQDSLASWWTTVGKALLQPWRWLLRLQRQAASRQHKRKLRLRETLPLGEKRFLAVVQFEQEQFLVGGTGQSISLLARLKSEDSLIMPTRHGGES
jgi:flagellar biogenesis protein FliO